MASLNKVLLIGNITRDPVLKYLPSGTAVVEFGLAMNRTWRDQQSGETREATAFVDCKALGRPAEVINQYKKKGDALFVEGRLEYRQWEGKDGSKRNKLEVFVENFQFLGGRREDGGSGGGPGAGAGRPGRPAAAAASAPSDDGADFGIPSSGSNFDDDTPF